MSYWYAHLQSEAALLLKKLLAWRRRRYLGRPGKAAWYIRHVGAARKYMDGGSLQYGIYF